MGTITTTTNTAPFVWPGNRLVAKVLGVNRWMAVVKSSTANQYLIQRSTDFGANWSTLTTITRSNVVDIGSIYCDNQGWLFWCYRTNESSNDYVWARRLETATGSNKPDTGEVLVGSAPNGGVAGAVLNGLSICSHYNLANGYHYIPVAIGTTHGSLQGVTLVCAVIDTVGTITEQSARHINGAFYVTESAGRVGPSIDKEHAGDGYSAGQSPNLWVSFGRSNLSMVKLAWSGDGWITPSQSLVVRSAIGSRDTVPALWDGNRFLMCIPDPTNTDRVLVYERNRANTLTTMRQTPVHPTGVVRQATIAYDYYSGGNMRVFAVGTSTAVLYWINYVRGTDTWGSWTAVTGSPAVIGTNVDNFGVKRDTSQDASYGPYYATGTSPFTLTYTQQSQAYAPNTPTWVSPTSGSAQDVAQSLPLVWSFTDPDAADTQSAYALSRQVGAGSLEYWRASDSTWQVAEVQNTSGTSALTLTATQWSLDGAANGATDPAHTYKVKVWDQANTASSYSVGLLVIPAALVNPAITAPTAAQVLTTDHVTMTWTATEQTQFRVQLNVQSGSQVYDSGWIADSVTRSYLVPYVLANGSAWTLTLTTKNNEGLASTAQTRNFSISYITPAAPTVALTALPASGIVRAVITNPTAIGSQPAVADQDLYRRTVIGSPLNSNPYFETDTSGWTQVNSTVSRSTTQKHEGVASCRIVPNGVSADCYAEATKVVISQTLSYQVEAWIRADTANKPIRVYLLWYTAGDVFISSTVFSVTPVATAWHYLVGSIAASTVPTAGKVSAAVGVGSTPAAGDAIYADEVELTVANATTPVRVAATLASGATYDDWQAVGGVTYEYQVLTRATNGTSTTGAWTQ